MALPGFRTRGPGRDRATDVGRLQRLNESLAAIRGEMEQEKNGLRDRYDKVMANAAFSQQSFEDGRGGAGISSKIDEMTDTMIRYADRIASLDMQIDFVTGLEQQVGRFSDETAG
jgi:hypothetical protein